MRLLTPVSQPRASHTEYAVASGSTEAEKSEALKSPKAKRAAQWAPASGRSACAASAAVSIGTPPACSVAAQATMMKKATTSVKMQPLTTSRREYG